MPVVNFNKWAYRLVEDRHDGMGKVPVFDQEAFQLGITFKAKVSPVPSFCFCVFNMLLSVDYGAFIVCLLASHHTSVELILQNITA